MLARSVIFRHSRAFFATKPTSTTPTSTPTDKDIDTNETPVSERVPVSSGNYGGSGSFGENAVEGAYFRKLDKEHVEKLKREQAEKNAKDSKK